jgi:hypothetical protein
METFSCFWGIGEGTTSKGGMNMGKQTKPLCRETVQEGFARLAFGSVTDAVLLLFSDNWTREELEKMDLFCISEIKRPKGGGMEIKLVDRIKAMQCLAESMDTTPDDTARLYQALERSAAALEEDAT